MKVNLINYTGYDPKIIDLWNQDQQYAARLLCYIKNTRLTQGDETRKRYFSMPWKDIEKELEEVANTIRSSWEFVDYTFEIIGVTRAFTHQLVRTREASYAQQAMRVTDMGSFDATEPVAIAKDETSHDRWEYLMGEIRSAYNFFRHRGIAAQDARGALPTNVQTNIIMKMDLREMSYWLPKRDNLRVQDEYVEVAREVERLVLEVHPWAKPFLRPDRLSTPSLEAILRRALGSASPVDRPEINAALKELDKLKGIWG